MHMIATLDEIGWDGMTGLAVIVMGCTIAIVAIVFGSIKSMVRRREIERSRREIAAYVAEGSISPKDAQRLLKTDPKGEGDEDD